MHTKKTRSLKVPFGDSMDLLIKGRDLVVNGFLGIDPEFVLNPNPDDERVDDPARQLKQAANAMRALALQESGGINYGMLADSEEYAKFRRFSQALQSCRVEDLGDRDHQIAFWINIYNALILDGILHFKLEKSMLEDPGFFRRAAYQIGGLRFSADDIEHGVLRGNRKAPSLPFPHFASDDPRLKLSIREPDPRIHFALVCGAYSCPPIAFYDGELLEGQLEAAARTFIQQGGVHVDASSSTLKLSRIFQWYRADFEAQGGVIDFVARYLEPGIIRSRQGWRHSYLPYNWNLNGGLG